MEELGLVIGLVTLSALVWTIIENVFFVKKVLVNSKKYNEKVRKRTKILFPISVVLTAVMIFICFRLANSSLMFITFVNYIYYFFIILPYLIGLWIVIELIMLLVSSIRRPVQDNSEDNQIGKSNILFPILAGYLGVSILIRFLFEKLCEQMFSK